jgi:hypothetical protein
MSSPTYEPRAFLDTLTGMTRNTVSSSADKPYLLATIDPSFAIGSGNPKVTFDGETTMSGKTYAYISSYYPIPGDRVVLAPLGTSYVILGSVAGSPSSPDRFFVEGQFEFQRTLATNVVMDTQQIGDSFERFRLQADGRHTWGSGAGARDLNLYRSGVATLRTDHTLSAGKLIVDNQDFTVFTPTTTSHGSLAFQTRTGYYYKLGKIVFVVMHFDVSVAGSGTTPWQPGLPSTPDRTIIAGRQAMLALTENIIATDIPGAGGAYIFDGGSGAVVDRVRVPQDDLTNRDVNITGADLKVNALITIQGWYKEA